MEIDLMLDLSGIHIDESLVNSCPKVEVANRLKAIHKAVKDALEAVGGSVDTWDTKEFSTDNQTRTRFEAILSIPANPINRQNWQTELLQKIRNLGQVTNDIGDYGKPRTMKLSGNFLVENT